MYTFIFPFISLIINSHIHLYFQEHYSTFMLNVLSCMWAKICWRSIVKKLEPFWSICMKTVLVFTNSWLGIYKTLFHLLPSCCILIFFCIFGKMSRGFFKFYLEWKEKTELIKLNGSKQNYFYVLKDWT